MKQNTDLLQHRQAFCFLQMHSVRILKGKITMRLGHLHLLCGKIASGKSTKASKLARRENAVLVSEDEWLSALFGPEMSTIRDYVRCSERLRTVLVPHVENLLRAEVSVVLDFPANTPDTRAWMKQTIDQTGCPHTLHFLNVPDEICRARIHERNANGLHQFTVSDEQFDAITKHFVPPQEREGFEVREYGASCDPQGTY